MSRFHYFAFLFLLISTSLCCAFRIPNFIEKKLATLNGVQRQSQNLIGPAFVGIVIAYMPFSPIVVKSAYAGVDTSELQKVAKSEDIRSQLKEIEKLQQVQQALDAADVEYEVLPMGASFREFRAGRGDTIVKPGSTVRAEMTIRCKKFATAKEPGGVKYYDTKTDAAPYNELQWTIGDGSFPPALEEAMVGMKRSAVRRIELPSTAVFQARKKNQLPLPAQTNDEGKRRFKNLFKTDATLIFEIRVNKIENPA